MSQTSPAASAMRPASATASSARTAGTRPPNYKSVLCDFFMDGGRCNRGADCNFAHGESELRAPTGFGGGAGSVAPKRQAPQPCKWWAAGNCKRGTDCHFLHEGSTRRQNFGNFQGAGPPGRPMYAPQYPPPAFPARPMAGGYGIPNGLGAGARPPPMGAHMGWQGPASLPPRGLPPMNPPRGAPAPQPTWRGPPGGGGGGGPPPRPAAAGWPAPSPSPPGYGPPGGPAGGDPRGYGAAPPSGYGGPAPVAAPSPAAGGMLPPGPVSYGAPKAAEPYPGAQAGGGYSAQPAPTQSYPTAQTYPNSQSYPASQTYPGSQQTYPAQNATTSYGSAQTAPTYPGTQNTASYGTYSGGGGDTSAYGKATEDASAYSNTSQYWQTPTPAAAGGAPAAAAAAPAQANTQGGGYGTQGGGYGAPADNTQAYGAAGGYSGGYQNAGEYQAYGDGQTNWGATANGAAPAQYGTAPAAAEYPASSYWQQ